MKAGDLAPEFELPDESGTPCTLSGFLETGPVVLFFYPAAMTKGCTAESCHFRDLAAEFEAVKAHRVGISPDDVAKQKEFSERHTFDFPLLSDTDGAVAEQFGVRRGLLAKFMPVKRTTFVIGSDLTILKVIASELRANTHADQALEFLRR